MVIRFDSWDKRYKLPFGCVRQREKCRLCIEIPRRLAARQVWLVLQQDGGAPSAKPMAWQGLEDGYDRYRAAISLPDCGLYFYWFRLEGADGELTVFHDMQNRPAIGQGTPWQLTCYGRQYDTPGFWKGAVMYQIFPDRFWKAGDCDTADKLTPFSVHEHREDVPNYFPGESGKWNNDFFGGNLNGITEKLPYLQDLGVAALYLNPIFMAYSNHRYDTADYLRIDPMLGCEDDFRTLCAAAHKAGMRVILDGVFSHTGSDSVYFDKENRYGGGAYHDPASRYQSWYQFQKWPNEYTAWWGVDTLPCVNELDASYLDYIIEGEDSVIAHWLRAGADGFRLDVADELPDEFIRRLHKKVKQIKPDGIVIGEVWEDASSKESYGVRRTYFTQPELDSVMNYPFREAILALFHRQIDGNAFAARTMTIAEHYPKPILDCVMNSLSTHDTPRILTVLGEPNPPHLREERAMHKLSQEALRCAVEQELCAAALQFCLPGMACIYYGDEAGLEGFEDPFNRRFYPWGAENRTLMEGYRYLCALKRELPALQTGDIYFLPTDGQRVCFRRQLGEQVVTMAVNLETEPMPLALNGQVVRFCRNAQRRGETIAIQQNGFAVLG